MEECLPNCDGFSILQNCGIKNYHSSTEDMLVQTKIIQSWKSCDLCCAVGHTRLSQWHSGIIYGCICEALLTEESAAHFVEEFLLMTGFVLAFFPQCAPKPNSNYQFVGEKHKKTFVFISSCRCLNSTQKSGWERQKAVGKGYPSLLGVILCDEWLLMLTVLEASAAPSESHGHKQQQHTHLV